MEPFRLMLDKLVQSANVTFQEGPILQEKHMILYESNVSHVERNQTVVANGPISKISSNGGFNLRIVEVSRDRVREIVTT